MDRAAQMRQMTRRLHAAAQGKDWQALAGLDQQLASSLPVLAAEGPWTDAERRALEALYAEHLSASRQCALEAEAMAQRLDALRASKDGWLAYAINEDWAEQRT